MSHSLQKLCLVLAAIAALGGCKTTLPRQMVSSNAALPVMERVALSANACWFKSKDPAFAAYKLAPELNSFSGAPRILLVPAHSPESRPLAVIQAAGNPAKLSAFGPLLAEPLGARISADASRWARGTLGC